MLGVFNVTFNMFNSKEILIRSEGNPQHNADWPRDLINISIII